MIELLVIFGLAKLFKKGRKIRFECRSTFLANGRNSSDLPTKTIVNHRQLAIVVVKGLEDSVI